VPEDWEIGKFSREVRIAEGQADPEADPYRSMILVAPNHIESGTGRLLAMETAEEQSAVSGKYECRRGDVIYSKIRPALAKATLAPQDCLCSADMYPMTTTGRLQSRYLLPLLLSSNFTAWSVLEADRVAMPKINRETLSDLRLPIPSSAEQEAIADCVDREGAKIDRLIAKKRTLIERLKEKRSALISQTVTRGLPPDAASAAGLDPSPNVKPSGIEWLGDVPAHWEILHVGYLAEMVRSGKTPKGGAETYHSEGVLLLRSQNVHDSGLRLADAVFIDETVDEDMAGTRVSAHDLLLNITGASLGRCALAPENLPPANVNQHVCIIRLRKSAALPSFLHRALCSRPVQEQIFSFENGSSREGLNFQQVRSLLVTLPPSGEQAAIAQFLEKATSGIDEMSAKVRVAIERLQEYRTALVTAAVTGKIDVRSTSRQKAAEA
jgi:type I restriction enzyme S subunit